MYSLLGNSLAGSRLWTDTHLAAFCPSDYVFKESYSGLQEVFSSCVVTSAMGKSVHNVSPDSNSVGVVLEVPSLSELPLSQSKV